MIKVGLGWVGLADLKKKNHFFVCFAFTVSESKMPVKRGRLKPKDEAKIIKNYVYLKDNFDPSDGALDYMIGAMVFDTHDNDKVRNGGENTKRGRAERFIDILQNSGTDAIAGFNTKAKDQEI